MNHSQRTAIVALLFLFGPAAVRAQHASLAQAESLVAAGRLDAALAVYDQLVALDSDDLDVLVGRGHVLAWLGRDLDARRAFADVLAHEPTNLSAHLGVAYNHAWRGRYVEAEHAFDEVLALEPESAEARRGLAYLAQWRGDHGEAIRRLELLLAERPGDGELALALGQAHLAADHPRAARRAFLHSLERAPGHPAATQGLNAAYRTPSAVDLTLWGGVTSFKDPLQTTATDTNRWGLRSARLAVRPTPTITVWGMVDDGLSYDNRGLALSGDHIPSYTGGAAAAWGGRFVTKVEGGWRKLGEVGQRIVSAEQVARLTGPVTLKLGGWLGGRDDDRTERVIHGGASIAATPSVTVEALVFMSDNGLPDGDGTRVLVAGDYQLPEGWGVGGGAAYGRTGLGLSETTGIGEGFLSVSAPFAGNHRANVQVRHQRLSGAGNLTVVALGLSLGVWGR